MKTNDLKKFHIVSILSILLVLVMHGNILAAESQIVSDPEKTMNMTFVYGVITAISLLLAIGYGALVKKKETWLLLLFISVVVVNFGYLSLSLSKTLEEALLANRIAYLGSVFLPLCMLITIMDVCRVQCKKWFMGILLFFSVAVFLLAASPGYFDWYYKDAVLVFINGMAKLEKEYGPLHFVYLVYLLVYFSMMIGAILLSIRKKRTVSHKHAAILLIIVFLNIAIWFIEQQIYWNFEFLSVSYIISELLLLMLYGMMQDYGILADHANTVTEVTEKTLPEEEEMPAIPEGNHIPEQEEHRALSKERIEQIMERWPAVAMLTHREMDVLRDLLENKKRKDIAEDLHVTEHTIKKHTANIFSKLDVTSRTELLLKAEQETSNQ